MRTYRSQAAAWMLALGLSAGLVACGSKGDTPQPTPKPTPTPTPTPQPNPSPTPRTFEWATCDVLIKEGHDHGHGNMHGNNVRRGLFYPQEQRFTLRNDGGGKVTLTWEDKLKDMPYFQAHQGGALFGMLFTFKDAKGNRVNNVLTELSDHYQIFFTIAEKDATGAIHEVKDLRTDKPIAWDHYTKAKPSIPTTTLEQRTKAIFEYVYRDTKDPYYEMKGDGDAKDHLLRIPGTQNLNKIGMKGHFKFLDRDWDWDEKGSPSQLASFYLKISLKQSTGSKFFKHDQHGLISSESYQPEPSIQWATVFEVLLPVRVIANKRDLLKYSARYWSDMARAFKKTPEEMKENDETSEPGNDDSSFHM